MIPEKREWIRGKQYGMKITGLGSAFPDQLVTNDQLASDLWQRQEDLIKKLEREQIIITNIEQAISKNPERLEQALPWLASKKESVNQILNRLQEEKAKGKDGQFSTDNNWIIERTGIIERRYAPEGMATSDLAISAAKKAFVTSGLNKDCLDFIILATVTPDYLASPPTSPIIQHGLRIKIQKELGLKEILCLDVSAACSSWVKALHIAYGLIRSGLHKNGLLIGADLMSRITNFYDRDTCILFGDGASAMTLEFCEDFEDNFGPNNFFVGADGQYADLIKIPAGGSREAITPETILNPFNQRHKVQMQGRKVFKTIVSLVTEKVIPQALKKAGLTLNDIDLMSFHQANLRMEEAVVDNLIKMGYKGRVYYNIHLFANTTSASMPSCLDEAWQKGVLKPGMKVMLIAFGGGFTWATAILTWPELPEIF